MIDIEFLTVGESEHCVGKTQMATVPRVGETIIMHGVKTYDMKIWEVVSVLYWCVDLDDGFTYPDNSAAVFVKPQT